MAIFPAPANSLCQRVAEVVRESLSRPSKALPPWLFYDEAGSALFERITELPEYYLTRSERAIFAQFSDEIVQRASLEQSLCITELGAGTAGKTQLLLAAAMRRQRHVVYQPVDVSPSALEEAEANLKLELPNVICEPQLLDYTLGLQLQPAVHGHRRLVLYIGSSIGNFEPDAAAALLSNLRQSLQPGDCLLLGVDQVKDRPLMLAAYNDAAGVTAEFNRNILVRLNRELGANFQVGNFAHVARWNEEKSRIEMHLKSTCEQLVRIVELELVVPFFDGEMIHTENSYKYRPGAAEALLEAARFQHEAVWMDPQKWFAVHLARV